MAMSYYDLLGVPPTAPAEDIKRAFRREIAKYHPDKVQHLGREFQEIAAVRSADLTQAYKTLTDPSLRAEYDEEQGASGGASALSSSAPAPRPAPPSDPTPSPHRASRESRTDPAAGTRTETPRSPDGAAGDLMRRAAVGRFRQAVEAEFGTCEDAPVPGFELACAPPKSRFWNKPPPRVLVRFVPSVDAAAVSESWMMTSRIRRDDQRELCVFVMGPAVAPVGELARAIAEQMRKPIPGGARVILIPVNTRNWSAHIPSDAPPAVKSLVNRLRP